MENQYTYTYTKKKEIENLAKILPKALSLMPAFPLLKTS